MGGVNVVKREQRARPPEQTAVRFGLAVQRNTPPPIRQPAVIKTTRTKSGYTRKVGGWVERTHLLLILVTRPLTVHPFRDETPFLLVIDTSNIWALITCFPCIAVHKNVLLTVSPSHFSLGGHYFSPGMAIIFAIVYPSILNSSHLSMFLISPNTSRSS